MRRIFPVSYQLARHDKNRPLKLPQRRDVLALRELELTLLEIGYQRGEAIFNQAPAGWDPDQPFQMDLSGYGPDDLHLQCMRPPINDLQEGHKRKIARANTNLEGYYFDAVRPHIDWSARSHMRLSPSLQPLIRAGFEDRRAMSFRQKGWGAPYSELNAQEGRGWRKFKGGRRTALFLLRLAEAWKGGPGYLCAFGMDGCTTVVWAYRLARDFKHLLAKPGFVLAEIELGEIPPATTDLRFCMDWKIEPLLVHEFGAAKPAQPDQPAQGPVPVPLERPARRPRLVPQR